MAMALAARGDFLVTSTAGALTAVGAATLAAVDLADLETVVVTDLGAVLAGTGFLATGGDDVFSFEAATFWGTVGCLTTALGDATGFLVETGFLVATGFLAAVVFFATGFLTAAVFLTATVFLKATGFLTDTAFLTGAAFLAATGFLTAVFFATGAAFLAGVFLATAFAVTGFFFKATFLAGAWGFALLLVDRLVVFNASLLTGRQVHLAPSP